MMQTLESYVESGWVRGSGAPRALVNPATEEVVAEHPWRVAWGELAASTYIRAKIDARVDECAEGDDEEVIITGVELGLVEEEPEGTYHGSDGSCFPEKRNADIDDLLRRLQEPDFAKSWA